MSARRLWAGLVLLTGLMATQQARADEPVLLRYKFERDKPLIYRTSVSVDQTQQIGDLKLAFQMQQTDVAERSLEKIDDDGNFRIKTENKRLKVKLGGLTGNYNFDSTQAEREKGSVLSEALNPLYERLSGSQLTIVASARGTVAKAEGYEELLADLLKDNPLATQFAGGGSNQAAKMSMQDSMDQLGEQPVKPGDRWEVPYEMELPKLGKAQGKWIYTYEGPDKVGERATARIGVILELAFDLDVEVNGAKVTGKLSVGDASGAIQFDPQQGRTVSKKAKHTVTGNLNVVAGGQNVNVQFNQTQTVSLELLEKLPD